MLLLILQIIFFVESISQSTMGDRRLESYITFNQNFEDTTEFLVNCIQVLNKNTWQMDESLSEDPS